MSHLLFIIIENVTHMQVSRKKYQELNLHLRL